MPSTVSPRHLLLWLCLSTRACLGFSASCAVEHAEDVVSLLQGAADVRHRSSESAQVAPVVASQQMLVSVPAGASAGDQIQASTPDGQTIQFELPKGASPGQEVPVLYTPVALQTTAVSQAAPVQPTPQYSSVTGAAAHAVATQPVEFVDRNAAPAMMQGGAPVPSRGAPATSSMLSTGATGQHKSLQELHAMSDATLQKQAVNKVMEEYAVMARFDDEDGDENGELAFAKAEAAKKAAEWEAAADMDAAKAAEEVVAYKAWKRSSVLKDAAIAKNSLATRMGEYTLAKTNAVSVAGTDAAWKATIPGGVPPPAANPSLPVHAPAVANLAAPIMGTPVTPAIAPVVARSVKPASILQVAPAETEMDTDSETIHRNVRGEVRILEDIDANEV